VIRWGFFMTEHSAGIDQQLRELEARDEREGGIWIVGPDGGAFLAWLIGLTGARRVLEVGTSSGYASLWMGRALQQAGSDGALVTLEVDPVKIDLAREQFERAGLERLITIVEGPGVVSLTALGGTFDLVFIDADKRQYIDYLREIRRLVAPRSVIVADNITSHADDVAAYRAQVEADPTLDSVLLPLAGGLLVSRVVTASEP
jgi:predicted O-methyltransferase YrrM